MTRPRWQSRPATEADLPAVLALLAECDLPPDGLAEHLSTLLVGEADQRLIGTAGLELYGQQALLRSVAVLDTWRGRGVGTELTAAALGLARAHGVRRVVLLTTTAERYFERRGFEHIDRTSIHPDLAGSAELQGVCPASAAVLGLDLRPD